MKQRKMEPLRGVRLLVSVVFFFSSRRRHTRWNCDWSSDVCSSDLEQRLDQVGMKGFTHPVKITCEDHEGSGPVLVQRSEERRVGKECRSRWWAYHQKKKRK